MTDVFYSGDLDVAEWANRHARGEVPDRWPYGLDRVPGAAAATNGQRDWRLSQRLLRRFDGRFDWRARPPRHAAALCWDERTGVPVASGRHDGPLASGVIWLTDRDRRAAGDPLVRRALHRCDALWVLSAAQREPLHRDWGVPPERVHHVRFGVDERFWTPGPDVPDGDTVLTVGNDRDRDHAAVVCAIERARRSRPRLRLELATRLAVDVPDELGERLGDVPHAQLAARYRAAAVVVVATRPNLHASGMTAVLEAMACARPVVVSATPGMEDYVQDGVTGVLVPVGDERAMADAVVELTTDRAAAQRLGRSARAAVEQRFTSRAMAETLGALVGATAPEADRA